MPRAIPPSSLHIAADVRRAFRCQCLPRRPSADCTARTSEDVRRRILFRWHAEVRRQLRSAGILFAEPGRVFDRGDRLIVPYQCLDDIGLLNRTVAHVHPLPRRVSIRRLTRFPVWGTHAKPYIRISPAVPGLGEYYGPPSPAGLATHSRAVRTASPPARLAAVCARLVDALERERVRHWASRQRVRLAAGLPVVVPHADPDSDDEALAAAIAAWRLIHVLVESTVMHPLDAGRLEAVRDLLGLHAGARTTPNARAPFVVAAMQLRAHCGGSAASLA